MYCENCGKKIKEGVLFCPYCGEKLEAEVESKEASKGVKLIGILEEYEDVEKKEAKSSAGMRRMVACAVIGILVLGIVGGVAIYKGIHKRGETKIDKTKTASAEKKVEGEKEDKIPSDKESKKQIKDEVVVVNLGDKGYELQDIYGNTIAGGYTSLWEEGSARERLFIAGKGDEKRKLWGVIDSTGKEVVPIQYAYIDRFLQNWWNPCGDSDSVESAYFCVSDTERDEEEQYLGLLDGHGKEILPMIYTYIHRVGEEIFLVKNEQEMALFNAVSGKRIYTFLNFEDKRIASVNASINLDLQGNLRLKFTTADARTETIYYDERGKQYTTAPGEIEVMYFDEEGKPITESVYKAGSDFNRNGEAIVLNQENKWIVINEKGEMVKETGYTNADFAGIEEFGKADVAGLEGVDGGEYQGFISIEGKRIGQAYKYIHYNLLKSGEQPLLAVGNATGDERPLWGFINRQGEMEIEYQYEGYPQYNIEGLIYVSKEEKWTFMDYSGKEVFESLYDIGWVTQQWIMVSSEYDKWGVIDKEGKVLVEPIYEGLFFPDGLRDACRDKVLAAVKESYTHEQVEDGKIVEYTDKTIVYINPYTGTELTAPITITYSTVIGTAFDIMRVDSPYSSTEYADYYLYQNPRYSYSMMYPVQFTELIVNPDNGDGIKLQTEDGTCTLSMYGSFEILAFVAEEEFMNVATGDVYFSTIEDDYYAFEQGNGDGTATYRMAFRTGRSTIVGFEMIYPEELSEYYKNIGDEMMWKVLERNSI